jgi:hypothetical protein
MFDAGVDDPMGEVLASIRSLVAGFEADGLAAHEAAQVVEQCAEAERLLAALRGLQEECRRVEAAAIIDEDDRHRRVHRYRKIRGWVDRHNVGRLSATMTPDELARVMNEIDRRES